MYLGSKLSGALVGRTVVHRSFRNMATRQRNADKRATGLSGTDGPNTYPGAHWDRYLLEVSIKYGI